MQPNNSTDPNQTTEPEAAQPTVFEAGHQKVISPTVNASPVTPISDLVASNADQPTAFEPTVFAAEPQPAAETTSVPPTTVSPTVEPTVAATEPLQNQLTSSPTAPVKASGHGWVKKLAMVGVVAVVFVAGFFTNSGISAFNASNAKSAGKAMVSALVTGNKDKAYSLASTNLKSQQTAQALLQSVGDVQTTKAAYSDENIQVNGNSAVYVTNVKNLPADDAGKTNSVFVVSLVKHGVNSWKVDDVSVQ